jgi:hypothetical protein
MINKSRITEIFYIIDEFCQEFEKANKGHVLDENLSKRKRNRKFKMSDSEVITIMILFHLGQFRILNTYIYIIYRHICKNIFPETVSL